MFAMIAAGFFKFLFLFLIILSLILSCPCQANTGSESARFSPLKDISRRIPLLFSLRNYLFGSGDTYCHVPEPEPEPHPLRMEKWEIIFRTGLSERKQSSIQFYHTGGEDDKGDLRTDEGETGDWAMEKLGLQWQIRRNGVAYTYYALVHHNTFGAAPKMFRGVVVRDRFASSFLPPWLFRPVVATFHGHGVGEDTMKYSGGYGTKNPGLDAY
uniref:Uncharacterized protein n=1 Tax=Fibrocapsa japonica TaxID=94617 RepID=A0A7S2V1B7_9STRA|mmetsp:Transcript_24373/g.35442  ORF Transcript_24373/g.35442 Transcript_24373/m.35442 type:complete len:213 (+) Transcript_24373:18-656(+)